MAKLPNAVVFGYLTTLGLSVWMPIQRAIDRYGDNFDRTLIKEEEFLGEQGYTYTKYSYDIGIHMFFVCTTDIQGTESIIRWGIEAKALTLIQISHKTQIAEA
jgi:hypothetical protein